MIRYLKFWLAMAAYAVRGGKLFYCWVGSLLVLVSFGALHYSEHLTEGLVVTNMTDQVSWGIGIANFVYFVGVAAAAALLVTPAYVFHRTDIKEVVLVGELLAFCAIVLCLMFIVTDVGRPERLWHLIPPLGRINLPSSLLSWDVVVFNGYIVLNLHIPGYLLWKKYSGITPRPIVYLPFVFISIGWAMTIHVVTAFLLSGLGSRHFWNTAILAPRFLISAGASGPAILTFIFLTVRTHTALKVKDSVFLYLRAVLKITMPINLFLLGCEVFHEFYTGLLGSASAHYLYFGLHGHSALTKLIWSAIVMNTTATVLLIRRGTKLLSPLHLFACALTVTGVWIEKGMGLIFPGFTPSPLGEISEYAPSFGEIAVGVGVLAMGMLLFTLMAKVAIGIQMGELHEGGAVAPPVDTGHAPSVAHSPST
ncbi:MAG TPA: NrfD/PsrC family molybdoenzyme membrane anchor subunit [Polyangiales bacterium]